MAEALQLWAIILLTSCQGVLLILGAGLLVRLCRKLAKERRDNARLLMQAMVDPEAGVFDLSLPPPPSSPANNKVTSPVTNTQQQQQQQQQATNTFGGLSSWQQQRSGPGIPSPTPQQQQQHYLTTTTHQEPTNAAPSPAHSHRGVVLSASAFDRFTFALLSMLPGISVFCSASMWIAYTLHSTTAYWVGALPLLHGLAIFAASIYSV